MTENRDFVNVNSVKEKLSSLINSHKTAFLIGNGINLNVCKNASWDNLLKMMLKKNEKEESKYYHQEQICEGITQTEIYELVSKGLYDPESASDFINKFEENFDKKDVNMQFFSEFQKKLKKWGLPVLTTNYDHHLEGEMDIKRMYPQDLPSSFKNKYYQKDGFSKYYPWNSYYAEKELITPIDGFAVWHIHGDKDIMSSIRLGLNQYAGAISRAHSFIHRSVPNEWKKLTKDSFASEWRGCATWLQILFSCNLCIIGLSLDTCETFLRTLLIERKRFFDKYPELRKEGVYFEKKGNIKKGKKVFLENIGIECVEFSDYQSFYKLLINI